MRKSKPSPQPYQIEALYQAASNLVDGNLGDIEESRVDLWRLYQQLKLLKKALKQFTHSREGQFEKQMFVSRRGRRK